MLRKLEIRNFKSIREFAADFGRVNLFIGGNGAGKSNVLEAIGVCAAALSRGISDSDLVSKGVRLTPPSLMKSAFKNHALPQTFRIEAQINNQTTYQFELSANDSNNHMKFKTEKGGFDSQKMFGRGPNGQKVLGKSLSVAADPTRSLWDQSKLFYEFPSDFRRDLEAIARYAIYSPQTEFLRGTRTGALEGGPVGLHGEGLADATRSWLSYRARSEVENPEYFALLSKAVSLVWAPGWANQFKVDSIDPELRSRLIAESSERTLYFRDKYMHLKRNRLTAYDSSEGTLFLLFYCILLSHVRSPRVFAIDNVDNGLNPGATRLLIERMMEITRISETSELAYGAQQVFLTSHNPSSLDAFDLFDPSQKVFVVRRGEGGDTQCIPLLPPKNITKDRWYELKGGRNLSQLWLDGDIDGALSGGQL